MARPKLTRPRFELTKLKGKPNLYVKWSWQGKSYCISTGTENEIAAKQFLVDFEAGWNAPPPPDQQTVNMILDAYLEFKEEQYKIRGEDTTHWKSNFRKLKGTTPSIRANFGHLKIGQLNRKLGRDYVNDRKKGDISNATIGKELSILNAALNHCKKEGWFAEVPIMQLPPAPAPRDKYMTPEQVKVFLTEVEKSHHVKLFTLLALHTLSRKGAILDLKWSQVDMDRRMIDFNPPGRIETKKRRVPAKINDILYQALGEAIVLRSTPYVIEYAGAPLKEIGQAFRRSSKKAGMPWVTPHILRHTGATLLAQAGVSMFDIAGLMGDRVETVMKHYAKYSPDHLKKATDALQQIYT